MNAIDMLKAACDLAEPQVAAAVENPEAATPCSEWNAGQLISHIVAALDGNTAIITQSQPTADPFNPPPMKPDEFLPGFQRASRGLLAAASKPGMLDKLVTHPASPEPMPVTDALMFPVFDTYVHAWDLSQATGLEAEYPAELHAIVNAFCQNVFAGERQPGIVGPEVPAPSPASAMQELAAFLGRTS